MEEKHLKIDLGAGNPAEGESRQPGYLLQDIQDMPGIHIVCDIEELDKHVKPGQCEKIRMSHVLEHFPTARVIPILKMLYTLLEPQGELEVIVPNFKWHAALLLQEKYDEAINYAYGGQLDEYDFHKTAFTVETLIRKLTDAGFKVTHYGFEHSIRVFAIKNEPKP